MDRLELKYRIISKLKVGKDWGKACNKIQDITEQVLSKKSWIDYLNKSNRDMNICEGSDFIVFNGYCYDWREFDLKASSIVSAFLEYFDSKDLQLIDNKL